MITRPAGESPRGENLFVGIDIPRGDFLYGFSSFGLKISE